MAESPALFCLHQSEIQKSSAPSTTHSPMPAMLKESCDAGRFKTSLSFLFWQASEDSLEFAAENTPRFSTSVNIPTDIAANLVKLDFAWKPAFKFLLGYHFADADWDFNARWTCFYSKSSKSAHHSLSDTGGGLFPLWVPQQALITTFPVYGLAKETLLIHFNTIDFELAYLGGLSKSIFLKLHGGLKAVLIDQELRTGYFQGFSEGTNQLVASHVHAENDCSGLGPRIGFGSKWMLPKGCSLIADLAAAFALSQIKTKREDSSTGILSNAVQNIDTELKESFWVWRPLIEAKMGFQWDLCFGKERMFSLEAAYEIQHYWEQNMMNRYADNAIFYGAFNTRGNLILQGLSLTASLGY